MRRLASICAIGVVLVLMFPGEGSAKPSPKFGTTLVSRCRDYTEAGSRKVRICIAVKRHNVGVSAHRIHYSLTATNLANKAVLVHTDHLKIWSWNNGDDNWCNGDWVGCGGPTFEIDRNTELLQGQGFVREPTSADIHPYFVGLHGTVTFDLVWTGGVPTGHFTLNTPETTWSD